MTGVEHHNPPELLRNPAFTQAVSVTGPAKTVYVGGQDAVNAAGEIIGRGTLPPRPSRSSGTSRSPSRRRGPDSSTS